MKKTVFIVPMLLFAMHALPQGTLHYKSKYDTNNAFYFVFGWNSPQADSSNPPLGRITSQGWYYGLSSAMKIEIPKKDSLHVGAGYRVGLSRRIELRFQGTFSQNNTHSESLQTVRYFDPRLPRDESTQLRFQGQESHYFDIALAGNIVWNFVNRKRHRFVPYLTAGFEMHRIETEDNILPVAVKNYYIHTVPPGFVGWQYDIESVTILGSVFYRIGANAGIGCAIHLNRTLSVQIEASYHAIATKKMSPEFNYAVSNILNVAPSQWTYEQKFSHFRLSSSLALTF